MTQRWNHPRRTSGRSALVAALAAVALIAPAAVASTAAASDTSSASGASRARSTAGDDSKVDVLKATREEVRRELASLDRRVTDQGEALDAARAAASAAQQAVDAAKARVTLAQNEVVLARETVKEYAVEAYVRPPASASLAVLSLSEADEAAFASDLIKIVTNGRSQVVDVLVAKQVEADHEERLADAAAKDALARATDAERQLAELDSLRDDQAALVSDLDDRLDAALAEAAALEAVDRQIAAELAKQELDLRAAAPATPVATPAQQRRAAPAPTTSAPPRSTTPTPSGPTPTTRPSAPTTPPSPPGGMVTWSDTVSVGGIRVHKSIASNVSAMLNAATAAGLNLGGGGFRDPASQIALRRAHCGTSYYAIYEMSSSQCSPPTARPGRSMHEKGLAIDVTSGGFTIKSRSDPAFVWLSRNAARYGFYNLPSEPWHWSTNGN